MIQVRDRFGEHWIHDYEALGVYILASDEVLAREALQSAGYTPADTAKIVPVPIPGIKETVLKR